MLNKKSKDEDIFDKKVAEPFFGKVFDHLIKITDGQLNSDRSKLIEWTNLSGMIGERFCYMLIGGKDDSDQDLNQTSSILTKE